MIRMTIKEKKDSQKLVMTELISVFPFVKQHTLYKALYTHHLFQNEIHGLIEKYSVNDALVEEIERLREENKKLRANY